MPPTAPSEAVGHGDHRALALRLGDLLGETPDVGFLGGLPGDHGLDAFHRLAHGADLVAALGLRDLGVDVALSHPLQDEDEARQRTGDAEGDDEAGQDRRDREAEGRGGDQALNGLGHLRFEGALAGLHFLRDSLGALLDQAVQFRPEPAGLPAARPAAPWRSRSPGRTPSNGVECQNTPRPAAGRPGRSCDVPGVSARRISLSICSSVCLAACSYRSL